MNEFYQDIFQQPQALQQLVEYYHHGEGQTRLVSVPAVVRPILTGMGASFHAVWAMSHYLHNRGIAALPLEATDLLHYGSALCDSNTPLVYVSQSGASAEVDPILNNLPANTRLVAVTNNLHSSLAQRGQPVLPLLVQAEAGVASKTYLNTLAILWLLARRWGGEWNGQEFDILATIINEIDQLLQQAHAIITCWKDTFEQTDRLLFIGHGPHAATARQVAMMMSEWAKASVQSAGIGAYRHGFIESAGPGMGVVLFTAPGPSLPSTLTLAAELQEYGARVLVIENGQSRNISDPSPQNLLPDEFLSSLLNIIPAQLYTDALRQQRGISPGFRYISKIVTQL